MILGSARAENRRAAPIGSFRLNTLRVDLSTHGVESCTPSRTCKYSGRPGVSSQEHKNLLREYLINTPRVFRSFYEIGHFRLRPGFQILREYSGSTPGVFRIHSPGIYVLLREYLTFDARAGGCRLRSLSDLLSEYLPSTREVFASGPVALRVIRASI